MIHSTSGARPAQWPTPARGLRYDSARAAALLAALAILVAINLLGQAPSPALQVPEPATNRTAQVVPIRPVSIEPGQSRPTCGPDFYITGDLVGDANPSQLYREACGLSVR